MSHSWDDIAAVDQHRLQDFFIGACDRFLEDVIALGGEITGSWQDIILTGSLSFGTATAPTALDASDADVLCVHDAPLVTGLAPKTLQRLRFNRFVRDQTRTEFGLVDWPYAVSVLVVDVTRVFDFPQTPMVGISLRTGARYISKNDFPFWTA